MSEKKIRKLFVNRSLPVEVAELIDEIHSNTALNVENLSKSGLVGKALLDYKNKKLCQLDVPVASDVRNGDNMEQPIKTKKVKSERRNIYIW